jgi:hypothetical protein
MKRVLLLMVVSALLVTLGFAQTPNPGSNTDPANVKGCLGGSNGNYTVAEDGTRQIFKITTSTVDLKPHVGHEVKLIGHKATEAVSSGAADNSFAVTELSMIAEHCVAAAAAATVTVGAVVPYSETVIEPTAAAAAPAVAASTPAVDSAAPAATVNPSLATASTPAVDPAAPAATVSPSSATASTPAVDAAAPATTVSPSSATVSTPAVEAAAPAATASPSSTTGSTPAADAGHPARRSVHPRRLSATQVAAATTPATPVSPSPETVSPAATEAATPAATAGPSADTVSTPAAAATAPTVTHRARSLSLLISFVVLVIVLGTLVPLLGRWRKRKMLERTGTPNLSFTKEASSDQDKAEPRKVA